MKHNKVMTANLSTTEENDESISPNSGAPQLFLHLLSFLSSFIFSKQ